MGRRNILLIVILIVTSFTAVAESKKNGIYNIFDFGASNDTSVLQSGAINAAIEECSRNGGGKVVIPAGKYQCGTIFMKDNVELVLMPGSYIYPSANYQQDLPMQPRNHARSQKDKGGWSALIFAADVHDIAITGSGTIDGRGKGKGGYVKDVPSDGNGRPKNILFISCRKVRVSGITMLNSALWNQHYLACEDVTVDHIYVYNHCNANNDGIDIDGCKRFILSDSIIDSNDDAVVLKSTGPAGCEDVIVRGCILSSHCNAIKCGTESTGGYRNILISDCVVRPSRGHETKMARLRPTGISGISLEIADGGTLENVTVSNIMIEGTQCPLFIRLCNRARQYAPEQPVPGVGTVRNITISNVTCYDAGTVGSSITGLPGHCVENIKIDNFHVQSSGGLEKGSFYDPDSDKNPDSDLTRYWKSAKGMPELEKSYPEGTKWGNLPAYGLFIRHARDVRMTNVTFTTVNPDPRPAIVKSDVK